MVFRLKVSFILAVSVMALLPLVSGVTGAESASCNTSESICSTDELLALGDTVSSYTKPEIEDPTWMHPQVIFTYNIETRGDVAANLQEFSIQVSQTLSDSRG